ncbi:RNA-directed DNA polymerase [Sphingobium sp. SA2]|uniref:RNA-directed DNA polymerase n=1 Tax=Sphingobium sp. SA2 TaxID=1524832 RepID=UPI0028C351E4|nr:RNA-directed DNA polymerase [Sphingobium sp. SA2]MDT7536075.1 RNA-directed DNA polymerase [Sphingobium sp. SA2]
MPAHHANHAAAVPAVVISTKTAGSSRCPALVRLDVMNFFPSIVHSRMLTELDKAGVEKFAINLCEKAISTATGDSQSNNVIGVPQGLSVSGALSSIYMTNFDKIQIAKNQNYYRYVDDILLICEPISAEQSLFRMRRSLSRIGLKVHPLGKAGKTEIRSSNEGIDFLGYHITKEKVSIRTSSYQKMFKNILKVITDFRYRNDINKLIFRINLKITGCKIDSKKYGWMIFFSRTENLSQLSYLDKFIKEQLNRVGVGSDKIGRIKSFVKSYHEIRYNLSGTSYIPDFDNLSHAEKIEIISILLGKQIEEVSAWEFDSIEREFGRLISKEVSDLEKDVGTPS